MTSQIGIWSSAANASLITIWTKVAAIVPAIVASLIVLLVGSLVAVIIGKLVHSVVRAIRLDQALTNIGFNKIVNRAGYSLHTGAFLGGFVKWIIVAISVVMVFQILQLNTITDYLSQFVFKFLPSIFVAIIVFLISIVFAEILKKIVVATAKVSKVSAAEFLGNLTKWIVWVFAFLILLDQTGVFGNSANTVLQGIVYALAGAFAISFGMAGKDMAMKALDKAEDKMSNNQ